MQRSCDQFMPKKKNIQQTQLFNFFFDALMNIKYNYLENDIVLVST